MKVSMMGVSSYGGKPLYRRAAALAAVILALLGLFPAEADGTVYEYAYVRVLPDYAIYYVFDMDTMTVRQFKTNDAGALVGTFTGDPAVGADIRYRKDWYESFRPVLRVPQAALPLIHPAADQTGSPGRKDPDHMSSGSN